MESEMGQASEASPNADEPTLEEQASEAPRQEDAVREHAAHVESPTSGGIRFGLLTLIFLMTLIGAVLALAGWLGWLPALAIGLGITVLAMLILLISALIARASVGEEVTQQRAMELMEKGAVWLTMLIVCMLVGLIIAGGAEGFMAILNQRSVHSRWQKELGFRYEREAIILQENTESYLRITSVEAGGAFEQAGIREGEVIGCEVSRFFNSLERTTDGKVTVTVGNRGGVSNYWEDFVTREVVITIPVEDP